VLGLAVTLAQPRYSGLAIPLLEVMMMEFRRVMAVLATTQPIEAYGGVQLDKRVLEDLAHAVESGSIPMLFNHDLRRRTPVANVRSGVRERSDGYWEAWAEFDVPVQDWERFEHERHELGAPGGMSFRGSVPLARTSNDDPILRISADAHHFSDEDLLHTARILAPHGSVRVDRLYSFSFVPPALVVIALVGQWLSQLPPELLGAYLYDALKRFLQPRGADRTVFNFIIENSDGSRTEAHLETKSDSVLHHALETLSDIAGGRGICEYNGQWRRTSPGPDELDGASGT
jgi:hypothetical protein